MLRRIEGFHQDEDGDWVADLSCLHRQHVRHRPPLFDRAWVVDDAARAGRVGTELDCPLCDRAELPDDLQLARTAGPFDDTSLPAGLRRTHTVAAGRWGLLRVLRGSVDLDLAVAPPRQVRLHERDQQAIPPEVAHLVRLLDDAQIEIDFLVARDPPAVTPADRTADGT